MQSWIQGLRPSADSFEIAVVKWGNYYEMAARQIVDRENGEYDGTRGALNRRVELTVVDPGTCRVVAREPETDGLPGHEFAESVLAFADQAHSWLTRLEPESLRVPSIRSRTAGRRDSGGIERNRKMSSVSIFDGAVLVGLLAVLVTVYLAVDKRLRRVENRSSELIHRVGVIEGNQEQEILKRRGLSRNWTIALGVSVGALAAAALSLLLFS